MNKKQKKETPSSPKAEAVSAADLPIKKTVWVNIIFFFVTTVLGLGGGAVYLWHFGLSGIDLGLFLFFFFATSLGITVGYHRLFAHTTYKANGLVRFLLLFFGAGSFEQSALKWSSQHRDHHRYVDTEKDPYSIKKGFFYAHMGWLMFWDHTYHYENSKDLHNDRLLMHQHRHYGLWAITAGIVLPVAIGALLGHALGAFLLAVCARITFVYHATWFINSACHVFGKSTYDIHSTAKDNWVTALFTNGEGYHNYHHHFPLDYRNGVRWYDWDPSKWLIIGMARIGFAWDLKQVSDFRIMSARLRAEEQTVTEHFFEIKPANLETLQVKWSAEYERVKTVLAEWERAVRTYEGVLKQRLARHSEQRRHAAIEKREARQRFYAQLSQWRTQYMNNLRSNFARQGSLARQS